MSSLSHSAKSAGAARRLRNRLGMHFRPAASGVEICERVWPLGPPAPGLDRPGHLSRSHVVRRRRTPQSGCQAIPGLWGRPGTPSKLALFPSRSRRTTAYKPPEQSTTQAGNEGSLARAARDSVTRTLQAMRLLYCNFSKRVFQPRSRRDRATFCRKVDLSRANPILQHSQSSDLR